MRWIYKFPLRLRSIFSRHRADAELSGELEFHLQNQIEHNIAQGMSPQDARNAALCEFGGFQQISEQCRESRGVNWFEHTLQDLRFALRACRKNPGFAAVVMATLALGIGANTAIFSLVNSVLLQPLPYPHSEQLVNAAYTGPVPEGAFVEFQQRLKTVDIAASAWSGFNVRAEGNAVRINGAQTSSNLFTLLGATAFKGRVFRQGDELPGEDQIAIISYGLWQTRFGGDPNIVGRWLTVDDVARRIVGVMPARFTYPAPSSQIWIPGRVDAQHMWTDFSYWMVGRLKPGVDLATARAELKATAPLVVARFPWQMGKNYVTQFDLGPLHYDSVGNVRTTLLLLLGAVGLILLIACANVANLLLSKSATRQREIAVRAALGATRRRIVRQLLTESTVLAVAGGLLGIFLAFSSLNLFKSVFPDYVHGVAAAHIDVTVMLFALCLSLLTALVFGVAPALHGSVADVEQSLRSSSTTAGVTRRRMRLSSVLVIAEVALSVVLVCGAGLLIKSVYRMMQTDPGFEPDHLLTAQVTPASSWCSRHNQCIEFYSQLLEELKSFPGIKAAAVSDTLPLYNAGRTVVAVEGRPEFSPENPYSTWEYSVSSDYLPTMGIRLLRGRNFDASDTPGSAKVVLVEKKLADLFWPGQDPIGRHIKPSWMKEWRTVVGVVQDVLPDHIPSDVVAARMVGAVYFPAVQGVISPPGQMSLVIRTQGDPLSIGRQLPDIAARVSPEVPVSKIRTMNEVIHLSLSQPRSTMWLFTALATLALSLGLIGIYSVISYAVSQRTREIGIRLALGAERADVLQMVLQQGTRLIVIGLVLGIGSALGLTRLMAAMLHGVKPDDPSTFIAVAAMIVIAGLAACLIPSRRATRVDPTLALKYE